MSPRRLDRKMRGLLTLGAPSAGSPFLPAPLGPRPASYQLPSSAAALAGVNHGVGNVAGLAGRLDVIRNLVGTPFRR